MQQRSVSTRCVLSSALPCLALMVFGCAQGQTGGEVDVGGEAADADSERCEETRSQPLELGEPVQGISLQIEELVSLIDGEFSAEMSWGPGEREAFFGGDVVVSPGASDTSLTVHITPIAGTGEWVERAPITRMDGGAEGGEMTLEERESASCPDQLRISAQIHVSSANGALDEQWTTTFVSEDGVVAHADISVDLAALDGSFAVDVSGIENGQAKQTELHLALAFGKLSGSLNGYIQSENGQAASAGSIEYARFPLENPCSSGIAVPTDAAIVSDLQSVFDAHQEYELNWAQEEGSLDLRIATTVGAVCYQGLGEDAQPEFVAKVRSAVTSDPTQIAGDWDLDALVTTDTDGEVDFVQVVRNNYMNETFAADDFAEQAGISGIESSADQLSFTFGYAIETGGEVPASGELTILALTIADCGQGGALDPSDPEEGSGSAGCAGTDVEELRNAALVEKGR